MAPAADHNFPGPLGRPVCAAGLICHNGGMPAELRFPLYALADATTTETIFKGRQKDRRLVLFTSAEKASDYRSRLNRPASVVKLKEPKDVRMLLSQQGQAPFDVEIDPTED